MSDFIASIATFCAVLRDDYRFTIGQAQAHDALRAVEAVGISDERRVRAALRLVCCGTYDETVTFDDAFDRFFRPARAGVPQDTYKPRTTRPGRDKMPEPRTGSVPKPPHVPPNEPDTGRGGNADERRPSGDEPEDATAWQMLRARYSPTAAGGQTLRLPGGRDPDMLAAAGRIVDSLRLGRSRRWKSLASGGRFDVRRTIRASLQTGGDPVTLRYIGHPLRNPRFVLLVDGSRSMSEHTAGVLRFARALCQRSGRAAAFVFSTDLREVTRELRAFRGPDAPPIELGHAWGGGTKIGANLAAFVREHGRQLLTADTLVIICSDGLDVGDSAQLAGALHEIDRRSAGIVWLNPHAAAGGFIPSALGMRTALPHLTLLAAANDAAGFDQLARRLSTSPRIRGRRR